MDSEMLAHTLDDLVSRHLGAMHGELGGLRKLAPDLGCRLERCAERGRALGRILGQVAEAVADAATADRESRQSTVVGQVLDRAFRDVLEAHALVDLAVVDQVSVDHCLSPGEALLLRRALSQAMQHLIDANGADVLLGAVLQRSPRSVEVKLQVSSGAIPATRSPLEHSERLAVAEVICSLLGGSCAPLDRWNLSLCLPAAPAASGVLRLVS